jgi:conjugal transfer/entry exclusion protein
LHRGHQPTWVVTTLNDATRQFAEVYEDARATTTGDFRAIEARFLAARMQSSSVAIQVQSIRETSVSIFDRLCRLLDASWKAEGNLDSLQIAAQKQALQLAAEQQTQAIQATAFRLQAQHEAEDVARERLKRDVLDRFTTSVPEYTEAAGFLPTYRWTDQ